MANLNIARHLIDQLTSLNYFFSSSQIEWHLRYGVRKIFGVIIGSTNFKKWLLEIKGSKSVIHCYTNERIF